MEQQQANDLADLSRRGSQVLQRQANGEHNEVQVRRSRHSVRSVLTGTVGSHEAQHLAWPRRGQPAWDEVRGLGWAELG